MKPRNSRKATKRHETHERNPETFFVVFVPSVRFVSFVVRRDHQAPAGSQEVR